MPKAKIFALFAAINNYDHITPLGGCVNDANNMLSYLETATKAQKRSLKTVKLYDKLATKENIVTKFITHLGQATKEDICLFYFSGHGGQEKAPAVFHRHEPDMKLEVLACSDSNFHNQGSFLADKEIRYLIYQLYQKTNAQILTIFDCCHSGSNNRSANMTLAKRQIDARLMDSAPIRSWSGFIFNKEISSEKIEKANSLSSVIPEGQHVHLAACENKQSAYEVEGQGIFTSNLVQTLKQTKGSISYRDLISTLKLKIRGNFEQTPQLYATGDDQLKYHSFLGGITNHQLHQARLIFNKNMGYWVLNMGALHGINKENDKLKIEIVIAPNKTIVARIVKVLPDFSMLKIDQVSQLKTAQTYTANISGLVVNTIKIHLKGAEKRITEINNFYEKKLTNKALFEWVRNLVLADYQVKAEPSILTVLALPEERAIIKTIEGEGDKNTKLLFESLEQIAKWNFVKELNNPKSRIDENLPIAIHVFSKDEEGKEKESTFVNGAIQTPLNDIQPKGSSQRSKGSMRILIKNNSKHAYYLSLLYLSQDFGIYTDFIKGNTIELLPNMEVWANEGKDIRFQQEYYIENDNWAQETAYLKLIISTETFDITQLKMNALPHRSFSENRGLMSRNDENFENPELPDWTSRLVKIQVENPHFERDL